MAIEIDEDELAQLQQAKSLLGTLIANPQAKRHFERAVKQVNPELETEDDREAIAAKLAEPHIAKVAELTGKVEALLQGQEDRIAKAAEAAAGQRLDEAFARIRQRGFTDDGLENVKKLMVERNIPDPEVAAAYLESLQPAPIVRTWESPRYKPAANVNDLDALWKNEDAWLDNEIGNFYQELAQNRA